MQKYVRSRRDGCANFGRVLIFFRCFNYVRYGSINVCFHTRTVAVSKKAIERDEASRVTSDRDLNSC